MFRQYTTSAAPSQAAPAMPIDEPKPASTTSATPRLAPELMPVSYTHLTDNWLRRLLDRPRAFVTLASGALVIGFVPHLYTLATVSYTHLDVYKRQVEYRDEVIIYD